MDLEFLKERRIEIDAVLAKVGGEKFFEFVKYSLKQISATRDYNRAIEISTKLYNKGSIDILPGRCYRQPKIQLKSLFIQKSHSGGKALPRRKLSTMKKKAMILAVSDYDSAILPPLEFCNNNGTKISDVLTSQGYDLPASSKLIGRVDSATMRNTIIEFFQGDTVEWNDLLLFYFSGISRANSCT